MASFHYHPPAIMNGFELFRWQDQHHATLIPALLEAPRVSHAVLVHPPLPRSPWFQEHGRLWEWRAAYGRVVRAVSTEFFDEASRRACERCCEVIDDILEERIDVPWGEMISGFGARPRLFVSADSPASRVADTDFRSRQR